MRRILFVCILIGAIIIPAALFAEEFECIKCSYTYYTHMHGDSELPLVTNYKQRGVIRSKSQSRFLDRATYFLEGMLTRPATDGQYLNFEKGDGRYALVIVDTDGDMILGYEYGDITLHYLGYDSSMSGEFTDGTGKYKGIRGKFELTKISGDTDGLKRDLKMHLKEVPVFGPYGWNDHEMCNNVKGDFEIEK